jgi:hypothetical protein
MNKIVKSLSYNPVGYQTSVLAFSAVAPSTLVPNAYTIPRFSFFNVNGINYTFTTDYTFIKTSAGGEELTQLMDSALLYQGTMVEYPLYVTNGSPYEQFTVAAVSPDGVNEIIDHKSIFVYVKDETGNWKEWTRVDSLFLSDPDSQVFECRINENQRYTIKFGNNVYGKQPLQNYVVAVYYLKSDQSSGSIGPNILDGNRLFLLNTPQFNTIFNNIKTSQNYISQTDAARLVFSNPNASTSFSTLEDVTSMRNNAANTFKTQYRLIAANDFETFVKTNFGNIISYTLDPLTDICFVIKIDDNPLIWIKLSSLPINRVYSRFKEILSFPSCRKILQLGKLKFYLLCIEIMTMSMISRIQFLIILLQYLIGFTSISSFFWYHKWSSNCNSVRGIITTITTTTTITITITQ